MIEAQTSEETFVCEHCGAIVPLSEEENVDNQRVCSDCLEFSIECEHCGERIWRRDAINDESTYICYDCYSEHYTRCCDCNRIISNDDVHYDYDDNPYCEECYEYHQQRSIHDYGYKPEPIFYGEGQRYFGVELEIDEGGNDDNNANSILSVGNISDELIYIKNDGSIDDGMEIVTHPLTLGYHMHNMPWKEITNKAIHLGYLSHKTGTCGLHVHVNRNSFSDDVSVQEECISRVLFIVESFWSELLKFSRRTEYQLNRWAARYGYKDKPKDILDHAKKGYSGRYTCVNIQNKDTIEFRIFRGTLKYNTIIATLQLVNEICNVASFMSDEEIASLSWSEFVSKIQFPELIQYLKERRLYVNDAVSYEEDE